MPSINILSREISELIAAGEVIERPASVIKELIENSIDANSKHITVEIKRGGATFIRITDDGCGISYDDVPKAFLRHATSKITSKDDLNSILTLGFRGEALASVCAVSKVEIITKQKDDDFGTHYMISGSDEELYEKTGCPEGTTIIIRDLFYNVPARQKFMKKDSAEGNMVCNIVSKIALSHPETAFKLIKDNKLEFSTSGDGQLYSSIYAVYGKAFAGDMVEVDYEQDGIKVKGYVVKPLYAKSNRSFQNFFVNNRYIKSSVCASAMEEAYKGLIMVGKFPSCVIMIEIPPDTVDVNVHPAKVEVRFSDDKPVYDCIYFAVKSALMKAGFIYDFQFKPQQEFKSQLVTEKFEQPELPVEPPQKEKSVPLVVPDISPVIAVKETVLKEEIPVKPETVRKKKADITANFKYINKQAFERKIPEPVKEEQKTEEISLKYIGEAFKGYIISECEEKIIIIDKHAAHERMIFEKLRSENNGSASQLLLCAEGILLSLAEAEALSENISSLENMGFSVDLSNSPYVTVKAVPSIISHLNMDELIPEIAQNFMKNKLDPRPEAIDDILHSIACKAAIKMNDKNSDEELKKLSEDVYRNENIRHCPHGRPVMFVISKYELEKQFRRKV